MKKILVLLLTVFMTLVLFGCAQKTKEPEVKEPEKTEEPAPEEKKEEPLLGGWQAAEDPTVTEELQEIFDTATSKLIGVNYEAVKLLETQVVSGMNYRFLCKATVVAPGAEAQDKIVTIYEDLQGNCEVTEITDIETALT